GHYGIFSGRRWREKVYPKVRDFIASHQPAAEAAKPKAVARKAVAAKPATRQLALTLVPKATAKPVAKKAVRKAK
ncbi:MAG: polyhydroxyalkanoate depolymerase, partial [Burkholderiales bacterium]